MAIVGSVRVADFFITASRQPQNPKGEAKTNGNSDYSFHA